MILPTSSDFPAPILTTSMPWWHEVSDPAVWRRAPSKLWSLTLTSSKQSQRCLSCHQKSWIIWFCHKEKGKTYPWTVLSSLLCPFWGGGVDRYTLFLHILAQGNTRYMGLCENSMPPAVDSNFYSQFMPVKGMGISRWNKHIHISIISSILP